MAGWVAIVILVTGSDKMGFLNIIKDIIIKPKSLEEQRRENLQNINDKIYAYFLLHTKNQVPKLYANNKTKCTITMEKDLCIPKEIDFDDNELTRNAENGAYEAMNKLNIIARVSRVNYLNSGCVVEIDWS